MVQPQDNSNEENCLIACKTCRNQIDKKAELDQTHWQCLASSMWSEVSAVQVVVWRMLNRLRTESWAADQLDMQ